ncbi:MAG TPA: divalent-cation tolerance protein CutA [Candidatus Krumholzibacteria bacterium]|nr:divalent-cation tolerance protein CutA [Candidatus Krumholzibacteria bacterium]
MSDRLWIALSTFADVASATDTARRLVDEALVACAQVEERPILSVYRWQGAVEQDPEILLRLKIAPATLDAAVRRLRALHPYDVPQIVWFEAEAEPAYAAWAREQCSGGSGSSA